MPSFAIWSGGLTRYARWLHFVRVDGRSYFDLTNPDDRAWGIDPGSLASITERRA